MLLLLLLLLLLFLLLCSLVGKVSDKRINVIKLEHIPNDAPGCLRKTNSLSEFQVHPDLRPNPVRKYLLLFVCYLFSVYRLT